MSRREALGMFWFKSIQQRPYYSKREIKRGKKKGWLEVEYFTGTEKLGVFFKKIKVHPTDIIS
jgi:hypothetical protein